MKRIILILLLFPVLILAKSPEVLFNEANEAYANKKYADAVNIYEQVLDSGYVSAELYYNLGNAYYKLDNIPFAILNFERADKLSSNEDIDHNLALAKLKTVDKIQEVEKIFIFEWIESVRNYLNSGTWSLITIALFWLFFILLGIMLWVNSKGLKKFLFIDSIITLLFFAFAFYFSYSSFKVDYVDDYGILTSASVYVKSSPDSESQDLYILHEGTKVQVLDEVGDWKKIKIANGEVGWIKMNTFQEI